MGCFDLFCFGSCSTWPIVLNISGSALGSQHADGMKHLWTLWWMRSSIWDYGQFPFSTDPSIINGHGLVSY